MFISKKNKKLLEKDMTEFIQFYPSLTEVVSRTLYSRVSPVIKNEINLDKKLWDDDINLWHQAITKELLSMLSVVFYGGKAIESDLNKLIEVIIEQQSEDGSLSMSYGDFYSKSLLASMNLMKSKSKEPYFSLLIFLTELPLEEGTDESKFIEDLAHEVFQKHIYFWKKRKYCP